MFVIKTTWVKLTFEQPLGVLLFKSEQLTGSLTDPGECVLYPPDLALVAETILSNDFQLLVETRLLERTTRRHVGLGKDRGYSVVHHIGELQKIVRLEFYSRTVFRKNSLKGFQKTWIRLLYR